MQSFLIYVIIKLNPLKIYFLADIKLRNILNIKKPTNQKGILTMLKKFCTVILTILLTISLTSCKNDEDTSSQTSEVNDGDNQITNQKIGFIYNNGVDENIINTQIEEIRKSLNNDNVQTVYIENVSAGQLEKAIKTLEEDGCTSIVSTSSKFSKILNEVAPKYPKIKFLNMGGTKTSDNISAFKPKNYQAAYIAGVAAAYNTKSEKFAIITEPHMYNSLADINAFALGTQLILENGQTRVYYATSKEESQKAVDAAINDGCDIIFAYQNTENAYNYAKTKNIKLIGGEISDQSIDKNKTIISFKTNWSEYFKAQADKLVHNQWTAQNYYGSINLSNVIISDVYENSADKTKDIVEKIKSYVLNGQAPIFQGEIKDNNDTIAVFKDVVLTESQIESISWVAKGVIGAGNFTEINSTDIQTDFEIKS